LAGSGKGQDFRKPSGKLRSGGRSERPMACCASTPCASPLLPPVLLCLIVVVAVPQKSWRVETMNSNDAVGFAHFLWHTPFGYIAIAGMVFFAALYVFAEIFGKRR
jgi:hypothetical protein